MKTPYWTCFVCLFAALVCHPQAYAQFGDADDLLAELEETISTTDYENLSRTHQSNVREWSHVEPSRKRNQDEDATYHWKSGRDGFVSPIDDGEVTTVINIPKAGEYRVWLRYRAVVGRTAPVTLKLSESNTASHTYHTKPLSNQQGKTQEAKRPICFESEAARLGTPGRENEIWEYVDLKLKAGKTVASLSSTSKHAEVDALLITASKSFKPSRSPDRESGNLNRVYLRLRYTDAGNVTSSELRGKQTYHWRRIIPPMTEPLWYTGLNEGQPFHNEDGQEQLKPGEWSRFEDITDTNTGPGGAWATAYLNCSSIKDAKMQVQLAWYPHEAAVMKTIEPLIIDGNVAFLLPIARTGEIAPIENDSAADGVWGIRPQDHIDWLKTTSDVNEVHQQYATEGIKNVGAPHSITPKLVRLIAACGTTAEAREGAIKMLSGLGINTIYRATLEQEKRYGLHSDEAYYSNDALFNCDTHCPTDPMIEQNIIGKLQARVDRVSADDPTYAQRVKTFKMGDEIGAIVPVEHVNRCADCKASFHSYMAGVLESLGEQPSFFGVRRVEDIVFDPHLPKYPGLYESRVYYHCARYNFIHTSNFYKRLTAAVEQVFPNVVTYCNFSPHPPMFGGDMNHSDWFALTRNEGATMGWAEDWMSRTGSWNMSGVETTGYYAAMVMCAARPNDLPVGFYNVASCGATDYKMFALLMQGPFKQMMYSFGPLYAGAEGSNFWSERKTTYEEIARGAHAIGPADEIIANGKRQPAKVALLYNRSHEIWQAGEGGYQTDRLVTFLALRQMQIPVHIVLEEDLTADNLSQYEVLYLQGQNLSPQNIAAIKQWVEAGGTCIGIAGTGVNDLYNRPSTAAETLFGATQQIVGMTTGSWHAQQTHTHEPIDQIALKESQLTPAMTLPVIGVKCVLSPTTGTAVGSFADGTAGAVMQSLGKGKTLLLGISPGLMYRGSAKSSSNYMYERRPLIVKPALSKLGPQRVTHTADNIETAVFEHDAGLAVMITQYAFEKVGDPATMTVQTDRQISEVTSTLTGKLNFKREGDRIVIEHSVVPSVDVVILK